LPNQAGRPPVDERVDWDVLLDGALNGQAHALYQPIVDLQRLQIVGYEALARFGNTHTPGLPPTDQWFHAATRRGLSAELDAVALRAAFSARLDLPRNCFLSVNVEPASLLTRAVSEIFSSQPDLKGIVVEVTEHQPIEDVNALESALSRLRAAGALIAIDDAGAGYSGLQQILQLRPSLLKVDRSLVEEIDKDPAKEALVEMIGVFANRVDAWLLAEGIETMAEARRLRHLGVPLVQGYLFGRPMPPFATLTSGLIQELRDEPGPTEARTTLHALIDREPTVARTERGEAVELLARGANWVVLVDDLGRPDGLLNPESALAGDDLEPLRMSLYTDPIDAARRVTTRGHGHWSMPVLVTDDTGRYVGVLHVDRLLSHLASSS